MLLQRGRPRPTAAKRLCGNPSKRPLPKNEPQPRPLDTKWPDWAGLNPRAKRHWPRIARDLSQLGVAMESDRWLILTPMIEG